MKKMLDISHHQPSFDAGKVKSLGISTVFCRCAYATSLDRRWTTYYPRVNNAGLELGVYGFLTAHYKDRNNSNLSTALALTRQQVDYWIQLAKEAGASWLAIDQELEGGHFMGLSKGDNTAILVEGINRIRNAGLKPLIYCSASWVNPNIDLNKADAPLWIAYYPNVSASSNFEAFADGSFPNTSYGNMLKKWNDEGKLFAWQYGSTGWGVHYGVGSTGLDRNWQYMEAENMPVEGKQLVVTSGSKPSCEYFGSENVNNSLGVLPLGTVCKVISKGSTLTIGSMVGTWYKVAYEGREIYVLALPDRCKIEDYQMKFTSIEGKELKALVNAPKTQVFQEPDINKVDTTVGNNGYLSPGGTYTILKQGEKEFVAGMNGTWYIIKIDGKEVYCLCLPDRAVVQDIPAPEPEPEPVPPIPQPEPEPEPPVPTPAPTNFTIVVNNLSESKQEELALLLKNSNFDYKIYKEM